MFSERNRKAIKGFTPQAMDRLLKYDWPGNVRELMNAVERGVVLSKGDYLDTGDFAMMPDSNGGPVATLEILSLEEVERATIIHTLDKTGGNKSEASRLLGITRRTLHQKLKKFGLM